MQSQLSNRGIEDTERDCITCSKPTLLPENAEAYELFQLLRSQYNYVGMDAIPIGINYSIVIDILDLYGVVERVNCFEKIITLVHYDIDYINKNRPKPPKT